MTTIEVSVTDQNISEGQAFCSSECPVALAINAKLGTGWLAHLGYRTDDNPEPFIEIVSIDGKVVDATIPLAKDREAVGAFAVNFDDNSFGSPNTLVPFSFQLGVDPVVLSPVPPPPRTMDQIKSDILSVLRAQRLNDRAVELTAVESTAALDVFVAATRANLYEMDWENAEMIELAAVAEMKAAASKAAVERQQQLRDKLSELHWEICRAYPALDARKIIDALNKNLWGNPHWK